MEEIYEKNHIKNIGRGINRLRECAKGDLLIAELQRCWNISMFEQFMSHISSYYFLCYGEYLINNLEYIEIMEMAHDNEKRKSMISNIIIYSCIGQSTNS